MDEWLPLAGVFLVVTGLLLGLYLLFRRRPQPDRLRAADLDGDEPPRPAVFGKLTSPLALRRSLENVFEPPSIIMCLGREVETTVA